jgi:sec-independent protein translocase protein TatB
VFGLSFGEFLTVLLVAMVVLGPKELPKYLRKAGQFAGRMRRIANDMREKSGIDEVLRTEGLDRDIAEIRSLTRGELTGVVAAVRSTRNAIALEPPTGTVAANPYAGTSAAPASAGSPAGPPPASAPPVEVLRVREFPNEGADSYDALPESAPVYNGALSPSPLAHDPLYARGEDDAPLASSLELEARS